MFDAHILATVESILSECRSAGLRTATAESCTGGLIAGALTEVAGSSDVFDRGFVTYSNAAKTEVLGLPADLISGHGAVSRAVAVAMADGALNRSKADVVVAVTGVAGPGGGSADKPVGLVHMAAAKRGRAPQHVERRYGDCGRSEVRRQTVLDALELIRAQI